MKEQRRFIAAFVVFLCAAGLTGCDMISGYFRAQRAAVEWEGEIEEIAFEKLEKDGKVFDIEMHSRIDYPLDKVWEAVKQPERLAAFSEQYKKSDIIKDEGSAKEVEIHLMALDNLQALTIRMEYDDAAHRATIKTLTSTIADIDGSYTLSASPDGQKTLYVYKAKQTDKVALPISTDVQRSAIRESFVNQIRAMKKQLAE